MLFVCALPGGRYSLYAQLTPPPEQRPEPVVLWTGGTGSISISQEPYPIEEVAREDWQSGEWLPVIEEWVRVNSCAARCRRGAKDHRCLEHRTVGDGPFERTDHIAQTKYQAALAAIEILRRLARIREARAHGASLGRAGQREVLERHAYQLGRMWVEFLASMTAPPKKQPTKKVRARARKEVMG